MAASKSILDGGLKEYPKAAAPSDSITVAKADIAERGTTKQAVKKVIRWLSHDNYHEIIIIFAQKSKASMFPPTLGGG